MMIWNFQQYQGNIPHDNINRSFICDDGVHLNQKGTHILASNFVDFINGIYNCN